MSDIAIRPMTDDDAARVFAIYGAGIATGHATFETSAPSWERFTETRLPDHRLVATIDDAVVAWAALSPVSDRCAYQGVAEDSIYVDAEARGRGVGRRLLAALVEGAERDGIWTVQTGIFPENIASVRVHHVCGFRTVGTRERLAQHQGVWRDVLFLERRTELI
jgi:L-amino acid N-acyltransferase YncA